MNEKYQIMTLKYFYSILDLKKYEDILKNNGFESIMEENDHFNYFSLLSNGDTELFTEEENNELMSFEKYSIEELLSNQELLNKFFDLIAKTYKKYYFSTSKGDYNYFSKMDIEHMVPDDAFALSLNYKIPYTDNEDLDEIREKYEGLLSKIINDIQFVAAPNQNIKLAVLKQNEYDLMEEHILK